MGRLIQIPHERLVRLRIHPLVENENSARVKWYKFSAVFKDQRGDML